MALSCGACRAELHSEAAYCPHCGEATLYGRRRVAAEVRARAADEIAAGRLLLLVFGGTLAAVALPLLVDDFQGSEAPPLGAVLLQSAGWIAVLLLGLRMTDEPAARVLLGAQRPRPVDAARALAVAVVGFGLAAAWVGLVDAWIASGQAVLVEPTPAELLAVLVMAPVLEELLDRGLAWHGARRLGGERMAWILTSILFAAAHGLNGGWVLEFPHRLAGGFLLGWLRWRSGSVLPGMGAHFGWNALATFTSNT